ncbi:type IX secretion system membrane protein PorP/SprF [Spirosoma soli]|uniref:Type IX secretion system membrane protein PorP/SprF n=1 Tax=Spirosoma soli TaxID=1770529 RepID=A0ABW5MCS6_9BACT
MIRTFYVYAFMLLAGSVQTVWAQTLDPQLSMYMYNPVYYNPAAVGSEGVSRVQITQRVQYAGYQTTVGDEGGTQSTQLISFNMPLAKIKSGIGIYAFNDKAAANFQQAVQVAYAYRMPLKDGTLSLGIQAGFLSKGLDYDLFRPNVPDDPSIPTGRVSQARLDVGAGVYYNTTDYWLGVSVKHINQTTYTLITERSTDPLNPNVYLTAGYRLGLGYNIDVQPSILVQYATKTGIENSTATFNVVGTYDNRIWGGVGYRFGDAIMATAGINLMRNNALRVGYSLDVTAVGAQVKSATSHEILLAYALPVPDARKKPIIRTPRFRY